MDTVLATGDVRQVWLIAIVALIVTVGSFLAGMRKHPRSKKSDFARLLREEDKRNSALAQAKEQQASDRVVSALEADLARIRSEILSSGRASN